MALTPGTRLGVYEVTASIGEGGMGQVWRARDTKLNRDVALKVLPDSFATDPDRLARFSREAQTLASLNHPNIAQIYGIEDNALVMELVDGPTLADVISGSGPQALSVSDALPIARQIAEALEAAHEQGIIHRDLKPANIKVTPDGTVKVLDFGLAKAMDPPSPGATAGKPGYAMNSPTMTSPAMTAMGMILGTAAYMAPEQARGKAVDKRADIWAFGVVLYEMLSGRRAFEGEDISTILASVLKDDVRWDHLPKDLPAPLTKLVRRCLERDPKQRLQAIGEARIAIDEVVSGGPVAESSSGRPAATSPPRAWMAAVAVLGVLLVVSVTMVVGHLRETPTVPATVAFDLAVPEAIGQLRVFDAPVVSPDGRYVALTGSNGLSVRPIDSTEARLLDGTAPAGSPFWSPDSRTIAYFRNTTIGGEAVLKRVSIAGGAPDAGVTLPTTGYSGAWAPDGTIVVNSQGGFLRMPAGGGALTPLLPLDTTRGETTQLSASFLPDGRHLLYVSIAENANNATVRVLALDTNQTTDVMTGVRDARYATAADGTGRLLFVKAGELWAQMFDPRSLKLSGEPVRIAAGVENRSPLPGAAFSASTNGVLVYRVSVPPEQSQLVWRDRTGKSLGTVGDPAIYSNPSLSLDDRWLAVSKVDERVGTRDVWVIDLARKAASHLTQGAADDTNPVWSPDGREVAYSTGGTVRDIFKKLASGVGEPNLVLKSNGQNNLEDWSSDGRDLLYNSGSSSIWSVPASGDGTPTALSKGQVIRDQAQLSPDERWLAYRESGNDGRTEVYVQTFPQGDNRWQVSTAGGQQPRWRRDGRELFYVAADQIMAVSITARGNGIEAGVPHPLFRAIFERANRRNYYVVSADGQRFLVVEAMRSAAPPRMTAVVNWRVSANK